MNSSQHTNNLDNSKNVLEDKTINKANDLILLDEIRKIKNALNEEIARIVKKSSDLVYNPGDNKKLDEKRAKVNFLEAVYNGYVLGAQIISSSGNHDNNNYSDIISPHLGPARSLADCVKAYLENPNLSPESRESIIKGANSRVHDLMVKVFGDSKTVEKLFKKPKPEKDQKLKKEIQDLIKELNTQIDTLDQDITKAPVMSKQEKKLRDKKNLKTAKRDFLQSIIDDQERSPGKSLGQSVSDKFNAIFADEDRAELFSGVRSRVEKLIKPILTDHKAFLKKQQDLINEMQTLENKLIKEGNDKNDDLSKEKNDEKFSKLQTEINKKEKKARFLANIQRDHGFYVNKDRAVKESVIKVLEPMNFKERERIIDGTFSRVNNLMEKVLGDSKTVKTLFKAPKLEKADLTNLTGDSLYRAEIFNLTLDLDKEINSFFPTPNKDRKIFKLHFLETLLNDYDNKCKKGSTLTLKALYETAFSHLLESEREKLLAGSNSRVKGVLQFGGEAEAVSNNASNSLANTNNTL